MSKNEVFSISSYLEKWSQHRDSVIIEGALQDDGDYYMVDRTPEQPGTLLRIRKGDVLNTERSHIRRVAGGQYQLYRLSLVRGTPVELRRLVLSDDVADTFSGHVLDTAISVTFFNFTIETHNWTITDTQTGQVRFNGALTARDTAADHVTITLASDGSVGEASYRCEGGSPTDTGQLTDGGEVLMNCISL